MRLNMQIAKPSRRIKLWQLLVAVAVVGVGLALLPQRIGIPIFLVVEGTLIVALLFFLVIAIFKILARK
jgi:hypothetical protein